MTFFILTTTFMLACESAGVMVCNTPQPAHRADTLVSIKQGNAVFAVHFAVKAL